MLRYGIFIWLTGIFVSWFPATPCSADPNKEYSTLTHTSAPGTGGQYLFIENSGQIIDQNGNPRHDIDYKLSLPGLTVFIGKGSIHYQWTKEASYGFNQKSITETLFEGYRLDVSVNNANLQSAVTNEEERGITNYYLPQCPAGVTCHGYGKIIYHDILPNIDWVLYTDNNKLKYDFILHPGANAKDILLTYTGATNTHITNGGIDVSTPLGYIHEAAPYSYITKSKQPIPSKFTLEGNTLGFDIEYDGEDYVIDPELSWVTYYGGEHDDRGMAVTSDDDGNVFLSGDTYSTTNIATTGQNQYIIAGLRDAFVVKLDNNGLYKWSTYFGGTMNDVLTSLTCDSRGYVYACGNTSSTGLATAGVYGVQYGGHYNANIPGDGMLLKLNGYNGSRIWSTYYGGEKNDEITSVTIRDGNLYLAGKTNSSTGIATTGVFQPAINDAPGLFMDAFIAKFDTTGNRIWGSYLGGEETDEAYGIITDRFGSIYVCGKTGSTQSMGTATAHQKNFGGGITDAFIAKCNNTGTTLNWCSYYGGLREDVGVGIALDPLGSFYIAGYSSSDNNISTSGTHQFYRNGALDGFVAKFDFNGGLLWGTYYGGPDYDVLRGISVNEWGKAYICGTTVSTTDIATPGSYKPIKMQNEHDFFFARLNTSGLRDWSSYYGGDNWDEAGHTAFISNPILCKNENIYIAGTTLSATGISAKTNSAYTIYQPDYGSSQVNWGDGFVGFFKDDAPMPIDLVAPFTDSALCPGESIKVNYTLNPPLFQSGNRFRLELSDINGSFANPIFIGSVTTTAPGSVSGIIPLGTPPGNYYMVRVTSTLPYFVSNNEGLVVKIKPTPELLNIETNSPVCQGDTLILKAQNINFIGTVFTWQGPDSVYTGQNILLRKAAMRDSGIYTIEANLNGCMAHDTDTVVVHPAPEILGINNNSPLCEGYTLALSVIDSAKGASYRWTGPDNFSKNGKSAQLVKTSTAAQGTYKISINIGTCSTEAYVPVFVKEKPGLTDVVASVPACIGSTLTLSPVDTNNVGTYQWSGPAKFFSTQKEPKIPGITPAHSGTYKLIMENDGCFAEDSVKVIVTPAPKINIITKPEVEAGDSILLQLETDTTAIYTWVGPNNFRSDRQSPVIPYATPEMAGTYTVAADLNGCIATATAIISFLSPGENLFILYPNPNTGTFIIKGSVKQNQVIHYDIYDAIGRRIYGSSLTTRSYKVNETITLPAYLSSGVYRIHLRLAGIDKTIGFTINK